MPGSTTNYAFNLPLVNDPIDADLWGGQLNANWSSLDSLLKTASDNALAARALVDVGDIKTTARSTAPALWLLCFGQAVSRTTYSALFSAIGTTYGAGDGSTTFNLPDIRGRVVAGQDDMGGTSANRLTVAGCGFDGDVLGATGGSEFMQQHNHAITDSGHSHVGGLQAVTAGVTRRYGTTDTGISSSHVDSGASSSGTIGTNTSTSTTGISLANAGTGSSQNVQPTIVLNYLIYAGV